MKYSLASLAMGVKPQLSPEDAASLSLDAYSAALASCKKADERGESWDATSLLFLDKACQLDLAEAAHNRCFDL
jgi:hypothetical protein